MQSGMIDAGPRNLAVLMWIRDVSDVEFWRSEEADAYADVICVYFADAGKF